MVVKQVFDNSLREAGKRFISSLKASNRYSEGYLASLETSVAMATLYAEDQGWPGVREITISHIEDYLSYLRYCLACCPGLNGPKSTAHEHLTRIHRRTRMDGVRAAEGGG